MAAFGRIGCTIVTGFLGAGKTTLIRELIGRSGDRRLAVLVNEFGDVGIDGDILRACGIEGCPDENIIELANGCICCTVADDFAPALDRILALEPKVDHIVIETSGLALPKPLVQAFNWPDIRSRVTVDGVVAVVDGPALADGTLVADPIAVQQEKAAQDPAHDDPVDEVFADQVACADLIVLTKADLMDAAALEAARVRIDRHLARAVKVVETARGALEPGVLIGIGAGVEDEIAERRTLHDDAGDHEHDDFDSFVVSLPETDSPDVLAARVATAAGLPGVLRIKGFAAVGGRPVRLVVQAVGTRVGHGFDRPWRPGEARQTQLVVIGLRGLDRAAIAAALGA